jgi:hypothetical protein
MHRAFFFLPVVIFLCGCDGIVRQAVQGVTSVADTHQSLLDGMLDCQERFLNEMMAVADGPSLEAARPRLRAEATRYRELGDRFIALGIPTEQELREMQEKQRDRRMQIASRWLERQNKIKGTPTATALVFEMLPFSEAKSDFENKLAQAHSAERMKRLTTPRPPGSSPPPPPPVAVP